MRCLALAIAVSLALLGPASAQNAVCPLTGAEIPPDVGVCPATGLAPDAYSPSVSAHWPLDSDAGGFTAGEGVALRVSAGEAGARVGAGCLEVDLSAARPPAEGEMPPGVVITSPPRPLHGISFWARSPAEARIALIAAEEDGSFYIAFAVLPAGRWQPIVIDVRAMILGEDNSVDENGQLDPDQIAILALVDVSAMPGLGSGRAVETLYLDDVRLHSEPIRQAPLNVPGGLSLGSFGFSSAGWMVVGGGSYSVLPMDGARPWVAQVDSTGVEGPNGLLACPAVFGARSDWTALQFDARSEWPCTLAVMVMEDTGGQYIQVVEPQLSADWQTFVLQASAFGPDSAKPDMHNGVLDADRVQVVMILEVESLQGLGTRGNVIQLARPMVVVAP